MEKYNFEDLKMTPEELQTKTGDAVAELFTLLFPELKNFATPQEEVSKYPDSYTPDQVIEVKSNEDEQ